ncbi:hypothetical protein [Proteus sp. STS61-E]|uniref:hypothetical protein n=1 Tax=Proteus sp. STS61-E TaxID=3237301 RepID=UPI0034C5F999
MWRFLVGLIFIGVCAGVYLWVVYDPKVINIIELYTGMGVIFSSIGSIATVFVFRSTAQATKNAIKSVEIAEKNLRESKEYNKETLKIAETSLQSSLESSRKDDFIKQFSLLIEQHDKSHKIMMENLNRYKIDSSLPNNIMWKMTINQASSTLYLNYKFSPYMRMLFRVLKHCAENFYMQGDSDEVIKEKKKYTSIVRSVIRNDVLYFVAINSKNENNIFEDYRKYLEDFDFFEHLNVNDIGDTILFSTSEFYEQPYDSKDYSENKINLFISNVIKKELNEIINENIGFEGFFLDEKNDNSEGDSSDILYSFNYELAKNYDIKQYNKYKKEIEGLIDYESELLKLWTNNFNESDTACNREFFLFTYEGDIYYKFKPNKLDRAPLKTSDILRLIIENKLEHNNFREYMGNETGLENNIFLISKYIHYDNNKLTRNMFLNTEEMYEECKLYIASETKKRIANRKDELLIRVRKKIICEMNKTSLITESEEKFVLDKDNKIVFEDKNS